MGKDLSSGAGGFDDRVPEAGFADGGFCGFEIVGGGLSSHLVGWTGDGRGERGCVIDKGGMGGGEGVGEWCVRGVDASDVGERIGGLLPGRERIGGRHGSLNTRVTHSP